MICLRVVCVNLTGMWQLMGCANFALVTSYVCVMRFQGCINLWGVSSGVCQLVGCIQRYSMWSSDSATVHLQPVSFCF